MNVLYFYWLKKKELLLLVSVFSKSLLTLVRSDLMSFSFLTARHSCTI